MLDRLNTDKFETKKTCYIRLNGNKMQVNTVVSGVEEIQKLIKDLRNVYNVYSMQIKVAEELYNTRTGFPIKTISSNIKEFSIADNITTPREIAQNKPHSEISPVIVLREDMDAPAVETYSSSRNIFAISNQGKPICVGTKNVQVWKKLNQGTDIVVDTNLNQIYPEKTGKLPVMLTDLLQHVR